MKIRATVAANSIIIQIKQIKKLTNFVSSTSPSPSGRAGVGFTKFYTKITPTTSPSPLGRVGVGLLLFLSLSLNAQSWQWGKRGGGGSNTGINNPAEGVFSIVTDSNKNIYTLSKITATDTNVDGVVVDFYDGVSGVDIILNSFACDGSYRWSKVIGGNRFELINELQIDAQDNIYVAGQLNQQINVFYPPRIGNDLITVQTLNDQDLSSIFIAKFNSLGVAQWIKRPMPTTVDFLTAFRFRSKALQVDLQGNIYWLVQAPPSSYFNGVFNPTFPDIVLPSGGHIPAYYIIRMDTNGNFIAGDYLDIQPLNYGGIELFLGGGDRLDELRFYRNHNTGNFYLSSSRYQNTGTVNIAGHAIGNTFFVACLDANRQFLWSQENNETNQFVGMQSYGLAFDSQNNVFIACDMVGGFINLNPVSFMGYSVPYETIPLTILKISADGQTLLHASHTGSTIGASRLGSISTRGDQVVITDRAGGSFSWDSQSITTGNNGNGLSPFLATFSATTGLCTGMSVIQNDLLTFDVGYSSAIDASGDIIMGGCFGNALFVGNDTLLNNGGETDFFVAKYSTTACSPLSVTAKEKPKNTIIAYPNPAVNEVSVCVKEACNYNIYNITGARLQSGVIDQNNNRINLEKLSCGEYNVQVITTAGVVSNVMILKN